MPNVKELSPETIQQLFYLDSDTLRWAKRSGGTGKFKRGDRVLGATSSAGYNYLSFTVDGIKFQPKRAWVVWLLATGSWPEAIIDHIDGNQRNDSIANLRDITHSQNLRNNKTQREGQVIGVHYNRRYKKPYGVQFGVSGKTQYFGRYNTIQEAESRAQEVRETLLP